jgi:hypothetical protein
MAKGKFSNFGGKRADPFKKDGGPSSESRDTARGKRWH